MNQRGYCTRTSVLSFNTNFGYKITLPPDNYPSAAPYAALTRYFGKMIKMKLITRRLLKQLLYPDYLNKMNLNLVRIRHHKTEATIMIKDIHCRDSIINCDSDSDSDSSNSNDSENKFGKRGLGVTSDSSCSSNPFGYIRYYNPQTGSEREHTKYESFIDYGQQSESSQQSKLKSTSSSIVHISTANIQLQKQFSEESEASSSIPNPKAYMACENLCNLNDNLELKSTPGLYIPTTRQSCPTKLVGNKFNQTSLTTIYIPSWSNSENNITHTKQPQERLYLRDDSISSSTTHSSSLEVPVNTLPLPDKMIGELLYGEFARLESTESDFTDQSVQTVIKPPTMFAKEDDDDVSVVPEKLPLNLQNVNFRKHSFNSDKPKRRSSIHFTPEENKRKVSSQYIQLSNPTTSSRRSICRCGSENCHSPRSSDSGMAGSCSLNSPDLCNANDLPSYAIQERYSTDMANLYNKYCDFNQDSRNVISLSEIEARNYESECPCTSPFGSTPRTSGQDCVPENIITGSRECSRTSVTSSVNIKPWSSQPRLYSKVITPTEIPSDSGPQKSQSMGCILDDSNIGDERVEEEEGEGPLIYKSGLYAHWWLKAKLPSSVLKGIYLDTRSPTTGKGMFLDLCLYAFSN